MNREIMCQGRVITKDDIHTINNIIRGNPDWKRTRISRELCKQWNWYTPYGQLRDMAARTMLLKLDKAGLIKLPPSQCSHLNAGRGKKKLIVEHDKTPIICSLKELQPLSVSIVTGGHSLGLFKTYLQNYHYLGLRTTVGENLKYLVYDKNKRPLACVLFGAAAWRIAPRDNFIGWCCKTREANLSLIAGNSRYLILPWIRVPHLASHILAKIAKRLSSDWQDKYAHPIYLLESFIQRNKFTGTSYKAANWQYVGDTQGRGKKDIHKRRLLPVKSIWLYPLTKDFRKRLGD